MTNAAFKLIAALVMLVCAAPACGRVGDSSDTEIAVAGRPGASPGGSAGVSGEPANEPETGGRGGSDAGAAAILGGAENGEAGDAAGAAGAVLSDACGDGKVAIGEACDDGNQLAGDGCDASCVLESGFACNGAPSVCTGPSCDGLPKTCGPDSKQDCCASSLVPGGTFYRDYDGVFFLNKNYPATVSDFRLDKYEISVGRFRKFVAAYSQYMTLQGAGKNPNNPNDPGWSEAWSQFLDSDATTLADALKCPGGYTWIAADTVFKANQAINCLSWFEAQAFCIWDGGRLPTEAEWDYAAAGGTEQREYPWGSAQPDPQHGVYGVAAVAGVGSVPAGDGKWGHADLAGNVSEWVQDTPGVGVWYPLPCSDCADLTAVESKVICGSAYTTSTPFSLRASVHNSEGSKGRDETIGARCARNASR